MLSIVSLIVLIFAFAFLVIGLLFVAVYTRLEYLEKYIKELEKRMR